MSIPGIGPITALTWALEIGEVQLLLPVKSSLRTECALERRWQLLFPQLPRFRFGRSDDLLIELFQQRVQRIVLVRLQHPVVIL